MPRRPLVLHICRRDHKPSLAEAVLARAGFGVLPARTLQEACAQAYFADVVVLSSCWSSDDKHGLIAGLRSACRAPLICLSDRPHGCPACTEVDCFEPDDLVAAIQRCLSPPPSLRPFAPLRKSL